MWYMEKKINITIMIIAALMFLIIIKIFYGGSILTKHKTIQLDSSLFNHNVLNMEVKVKNIKKIAEVNVVSRLYWYNDDEVILSTRSDEKTYNYDITLLNIKNNSINKIINGAIQFNMISPNKEKIVYYDYIDLAKQDVNSYNVNIYDIKSKNIVNINKFDKILGMFPDSSGYIGTSDNELFKYDFNDNTKKNILEYKNINYFINWSDIYKADITRDGEKLSIFTFNREKNNSSIYLVDLKKPERVKEILEGKIIDYELLNNEALIVNGKFNDKFGIYYYDINNRKLDLLVDGYCVNFKLSSDKRKIAYSKLTDSNAYVLCSAVINKNKIQDNIEVFNNNYYIAFFEWSSDNDKLAFIINKNIQKDYLYIADFQ